MKTEKARDWDGIAQTFACDVGGVKKLEVSVIDDYGGGYTLTTKEGKTIYLGGKPSFFFRLGCFCASEYKDGGFKGFVSDPEVVAPLCRFLIHIEEYQTGDGRDMDPISLPLFPSRREAIAYLRKAGIRVHGDTWDGFDIDACPYPDPDTRARLRKMGL